MPQILVTEPEYQKAQVVFEWYSQNSDWRITPVSSDISEFLEAIRWTQAHLAIIGMVHYPEEIYRALSENAKTGPAILTRFGVGMDNVNQNFAKKWNIRLFNTPGVLEHSVAEHTIWLLGAAAKRIGQANEAMRRGEFPSWTGMELFQKNILIAGFGGIGRQTAKIAHFGLGMNVSAFGRRSLETLAAEENLSPDQFLARYGLRNYSTSINELLPLADAVCVLLPALPETFHFFNAFRFNQLRENVLFVNTSRGTLVDENALFDFLQNNPKAFASLDVFETEPYRPQDSSRDLRDLENTFLTPHRASSTEEANAAIARCALEKTVKYYFHPKRP